MEKVIAVDWSKQEDRDRRTLRELAKGDTIACNMFRIRKVRVKENSYVCVEVIPRMTGVTGREMFFFGVDICAGDMEEKKLELKFPDGEVIVLDKCLLDVDMFEIVEDFWAEQLRKQREGGTE
ncbi:MAG: hypothetical protein WC102_06685 [Saccharofermentanales bacterium]|jgi:hypothetical protein